MMKIGDIMMKIGIGLLVLGLFGLFVYAVATGTTAYEMPDGTVCQTKISSWGEIRFTNCEDNKTYYNPASYKKIDMEEYNG